MVNVNINSVGIYVPSREVYNEKLEQHFRAQGIVVSGLMKQLGRRKRYFIEEGENAITMCTTAIQDCVARSNVPWEDIEMIVVCSDTPEFLFPSNAMYLTGVLRDKLRGVKQAFDLNSNCTGMLQGIDIVANQLRASGMKNALVVGCFCISPIAVWSDPLVYGTFGDAAACVLLSAENVAENEVHRGVLDVMTSVHPSVYEYIKYPKCGLQRSPLQAVYPNEKRLEWKQFDMSFVPRRLNQMIRELLKRNCLQTSDIDHYIFSQLSDECNRETLKLLKVEEEEKYHFVGSEYGYTGNTCTVLCLHSMWDVYSQPGNYTVICTFGPGATFIVMLYKW